MNATTKPTRKESSAVMLAIDLAKDVFELAFADAVLLPDQAAIEFSQDIGTAKKVFEPGETIHLEVNPEKINVFAEDGTSLMRGVVS